MFLPERESLLGHCPSPCPGFDLPCDKHVSYSCHEESPCFWQQDRASRNAALPGCAHKDDCINEENVNFRRKLMRSTPLWKLTCKGDVVLLYKSPFWIRRLDLAILKINTEHMRARQPRGAFKGKCAFASPYSQFHDQAWVHGDRFSEERQEMVTYIRVT